MNHRYSRTDRDLRGLAAGFSAGTITKALPERLECLAAYHRTIIEADKEIRGQPNNYREMVDAYNAAIARMFNLGVRIPDGEYTFSPCMGPDGEP